MKIAMYAPFITNSPETKTNQSQTSCEIVPAPLYILSSSKNNYCIAVVQDIHTLLNSL